VRRLRRLVQKRSLRWSEGVCVIEGPDLVEAALNAGAQFEALYVERTDAAIRSLESLLAHAGAAGVRIFGLEPDVLASVADTKTPQPVLAAIGLPISDLSTVPVRGLWLVLHDLRDPGNVGTIIRSAHAAGVTAVILSGQSVDPFNPKTLRATAGSIFHVPVVVAELSAVLEHVGPTGAQSFATVVSGGRALRDVDFSSPTVVVIGNEAQGLDDETRSRCEKSLTISMEAGCESLNAGVAASLVAFEARAQRQDAGEHSSRPSLEG
jgi:TrmH family RNA methyltransferase